MTSMRIQHLKHAIDLWRRLRRPFVLPQDTELHHKCEWEAIDVDVLGCRVCGGIHAWNVCTCKDTVDTSESIVCAVSGIVLLRHMYSEEDFVDTLVMTGSVSHFDDDIAAEVDTSVQHMLLSISSNRQHDSAFCDLLLRWTRGGTSHNLLVSCAQIMCKAQHHHKSTEVQRLTKGLLYLMRNGIVRDSEVILHKRVETAQFLPAENMLYKHYSIHPKFITETENRIKFCLRLKMA
jgi:hypothetical protein